jgi:hypothetical protein
LKDKNPQLICVALTAAIICLVVYLRALSCDFVNWEDQDYVLNNIGIRSLGKDFFAWAFTSTPVGGFWLPLTYISFAIDYHFWEFNPLGYHLTNILLHSFSTGLIVLLADRLYCARLAEQKSFAEKKYLYAGTLLLAGLLFGIHPARVESVAWVTERKDVLNGVFLLGSIIFYLRFQQKKDGEVKVGTYREYFISLGLFLLSLMAKPSSVVLPLMLLVLDWYPLNRLQKGKILQLLKEKIPYLLISVFITLLTIILTMKYDSFNSFSDFPWDQRIIASGNSIFEYIKLMLYPVGIVPHYDLPKILPFSYIIKGMVSLVTVGCIFYWRKKLPWLNAMMLLFIIPILPVMQILANGTVQVIILCRYTYIPSMVTSIIAAVLISSSYQKVAERRQRIAGFLLIGTTISVLVFYALMTQKLIGVWRNSGTMWSRVIAYHPFDKAYFFRGLYNVDSGNYMAAVDDYSTCLKIATENKQPDTFNLHAFRGEALVKAGRYAEAVMDLTAAISVYPHRLYYYHRGLALRGLGQTREAEADFLKAGQAKGQMYWFSPDAPL